MPLRLPSLLGSRLACGLWHEWATAFAAALHFVRRAYESRRLQRIGDELVGFTGHKASLVVQPF